MMRDDNIPNTIVRSSTIPEELGRVSYLLSDKTGTLTQNEMIFKKLHLGRVAFGKDALHEINEHLVQAYQASQRRLRTSSGAVPRIDDASTSAVATASAADAALDDAHATKKVRKTVHTRVHDAIMALALCTPLCRRSAAVPRLMSV